MDKLEKKIYILIFALVLTVPTVLWTVMGVFGLRSGVSSVDELGENRVMAQISDVNASNITSQIENYYNDRVPFRSKLILAYRKANSKMEYFYQNHVQPKLVGLSGSTTSFENIEITSDLDINELYGEDTCVHDWFVIDMIKPSYTTYGYTLIRCRNCGRFNKIDFEEKLIDYSYLPPKEGEGRVIQGRGDWLFYAGDNSIAYYSGNNVLSEEEMKEWLNLLQDVQDACDEKGIKLGVMVMPNKSQVYPEYMPSYNVKTAMKREDVLEKYIRDNSDIKFIYPIEELKAGKKYYEMYFPYDTHWTQAGAFIGTMAMYKELGIETTNIMDLEVLETKFTQKGLIDTGSLDENQYTEDIDYVIMYKPDIHPTWFEGEKSFIMPTEVYRATSDNPNGEKLVMIGDSFRLAMIPYFTQDYSEICVAHRHSLDEVKDDLKNPDVLIIGSVERFDNYMFEVLPKIADYIRAQ